RSSNASGSHRVNRHTFGRGGMLLACITAVAWPLAAIAQVSLMFSEPAPQISRGATLTLEASVTNLGSRVVYLNGVSSTLSASLASGTQAQVFFDNAPAVLGPGETWIGSVLTLTVAADAPVGADVYA